MGFEKTRGYQCENPKVQGYQWECPKKNGSLLSSQIDISKISGFLELNVQLITNTQLWKLRLEERKREKLNL